MGNDLKKIKKLYGEEFAKMCREFFPVLIEKGLLLKILTDNFAPNHSLYDDIVTQKKLEQFKDYVYGQTEVAEQALKTIDKSPEEIFDELGYDLIKCETDHDVKSFKKYYAKGEELCTFRDSNRINNYIIFFAVKKNVDEIKRKDFDNPMRQDEYGTSVISLQFSKDNHILSIKNRYNHKVENCDATFSNDLENIYPGLSQSFNQYYNLKYFCKNRGFELMGYTPDINGKRYKYNHEIDGVYYCANNMTIKDGEVTVYDKCRYELIDYFLLDKKTKEMICLPKRMKDPFANEFQDIAKIDVVINIEKGCRDFVVTKNDGTQFIMGVDSRNRIVRYVNENIETLENNYLSRIKSLRELHIPNVMVIYNNVLMCTSGIKEFIAPKLMYVGDGFLNNEKKIERIYCPELQIVGEDFMRMSDLEEIDLPSLECAGDEFMNSNKHARVVNLPSLRDIGKYGFFRNEELVNVELPELTNADIMLFGCNKKMEKFIAPKLTYLGGNSFNDNKSMKDFVIDENAKLGFGVLGNNEYREELLPRLIIK